LPLVAGDRDYDYGRKENNMNEISCLFPCLRKIFRALRHATRSAAIGVTFSSAIWAAVCAPSAQAQSPWPSKPVRMVIGLPPGSGSDLLARALAQRLTLLWGQSVVVDNRPGAATNIGTEAVARAAPDGHTILFGIEFGLTINPHLYARMPYDTFRDFAPITLVCDFGLVLVAHPSLAANNVAELIALAKSEPGKIAYASIGPGSEMHLLSEMLAHKAGIKFLHVPYKGVPQMMIAMLAGEVQLTWASMFSTRGLVSAGRLKALGFSATKRSPMMPSVPTFAELGMPEVEARVWYGLLAPAGTPRAIVDRIHADTAKLVADPEFRDKEIRAKGYEPIGAGPEEFAAFLKRDFALWGEMVRISGAKIE
jgi:tripartite-type tricarboxylate transporter receptor subunit TctC